MKSQENHSEIEITGALRTGVRIRIAVIVAIALTARLAYLWGYRHNPFFDYFFLDPQFHDEWAREIAKGNWGYETVFFRAPLYPYLLGFIYKVTNINLFAPRLLQFALGATSSALVYLLGRKLFSREFPAFMAGIIFALYGTMIYFEGELLIPSLIVFLDLAGLLLLVVAREKGDWKYYAAVGFILGLSTIARPNLLIPVAGFTVLILIEGNRPFRERLLRRAAPFLIAFMIFPILVTARNIIVGGDFVFIASQGGVNFHVGNNSKADGKVVKGMDMMFAAPSEKYTETVRDGGRMVAEKAAGRPLKPSEVSSFWFRRAFRWMASNPLDVVRLYGRKIFYLLHGHEIGSNNVPYFARKYSSVLKILMWDRVIAFPAGILIPLALLGMLLMLPQRKLWAPLYVFLILYAGTVLLFFANSRYRMPMIGPCILFALGGIMRARAMIGDKSWKKLIPAGLFLICILLISNINAFDVRDDYFGLYIRNLGNRSYQKGDLDNAAIHYQELLDLYPSDSVALKMMGIIAFRKKDYPRAEDYFRKSAKRRPDRPDIHRWLGLIMEGRRDFAGAESAYLRALAIDPNFGEVKKHLDRVRKRKQDVYRKSP